MWYTWKKMRFCDWHVPFAVWIAFSSFFANGGIFIKAQEDSKRNIPPALGSQFELWDPIMSSASTNILHFPLRNFTKVATIKLNNNNNNTTKSNLNNSLRNLRKPSFVLTLSLPSNIVNNQDIKSHYEQEPFLKNLNLSSTDSPLKEFAEATTTLINNSLEEINQSVNQTLKTINILDRLRNLTNLKLKARGTGSRSGVKSYGNNNGGNNSSQLNFVNEKLKAFLASTTNKTNKLEDNPIKTNETVSSKSESEAENQTPMSMVGGHILMTSSSSPVPNPKKPLFPLRAAPVVLKVGKLAKNNLYSSFDVTTNPIELESSSTSTVNSKDESINTGETRVAITADQLSGNRPTKMPFHFTSAAPTPPPTTTNVKERGQVNRYQRPFSPHNHVYAPTQDPVSIAHNDEDLNVEDFQDFRSANLLFGSKVGAEISTLSPNSKPPSTGSRPKVYKKEHDDDDDSDETEDDEGNLPVRTLQKNTRGRPSVKIATTIPTTTTTERPTTRPPQIIEQRKPSKFTPKNPRKSPLPQSASSGVKNAHVRLQNNKNNEDDDNDNLPFYKEPGGVFKEHSNNNNNKFSHGDQDDESNQISHNSYNSDRPGVKYAPKGATAQPHTLYPNNHRQHQNLYQNQNQNQGHHQLGGHGHVQVQQQPVYIHQPVVEHQQVHPTGLYPGFTYTSQQPQLQQIPQRPTPYFQAQPVAPTQAYFPVVPQQQIYPTQVALGFVPIQQHQHHQSLQGHQGHHQAYPAAQPISAPPVQPQPLYHPRNQQPSHGYNQQNNKHFNNNNNNNNYNSNDEERDENGNFPSRSDPDSDSFYGDPRPDTSSSLKPEPRKPIPPIPRKPQINKINKNNNNKRKQQQGKKSHLKNQEEEEEEEEEDEEPEEDRRKSRPSPPPPPPRRQQNSREGQRSRNEDYPDEEEEEPPRRGSGGRNNGNNEDNRRNHNNNNRERDRGRPQYNKNNEDYDGDYFEPNNNNPRPVFNEIPNGPDGEFVDLGNNFGNPPGRRQPFKPSPVDQGPARPSVPDYRPQPNFDHPNIQYPNNNNNNRGSSNNLRPISHNDNHNNRGPDYDPRGFGVGFGPSPGNVHLDPIYTRTIKQYDEELKKPKENNNRRAPEREEPERGDRRGERHRNRGEELHDEQEDDRPRKVQNEDDEEDERPIRRGQDREEERLPRGQEDEEERPRRGQDPDDEERERPQKIQEDEEEEEEEEKPRRKEQPPQAQEEEEEEERPQEEPSGGKKEEPAEEEETEDEEPEEEEEEEEEAPKKPLGNRQRKGSKDGQAKKPPPKKPPPNEKSGDLEDDIRGIEREFGGVFGEFDLL